MALRMARPWRDKTGTFHLRQRTPRDLLGRLRGTTVTIPVHDEFCSVKIGEVVQVSLRTREAMEAKVRHAKADAALRRFWEASRKGPGALDWRQATALAGVDYRSVAARDGKLLEVLRDKVMPAAAPFFGPLGADADPVAVVSGIAVALRRHGVDLAPLFLDRMKVTPAQYEALLGRIADDLLAREGLIVDAASRARLLEALALAYRDGSYRLVRAYKGDFSPDPAESRFPTWERPGVKKSSGDVALLDLYQRWADHPENAGIATNTKDAYRSVFNAVSRFLDRSTADSISVDDLDRYFETRMRASGRDRLKPKVARDVHKAALTSVFGWARGKRLVKGNPAAEISIKVTKDRKTRSKAVTDDETRSVVEAALAIPADTPAQTREAANRWCSLLALYTGSRIGEITQLRREDVMVDSSGKVALALTPEAGTVKDKQRRLVPVHSRVVELGFISFVSNAPTGPLFFDPEGRRKKNAKTPQSELVARNVGNWARSVGLSDPRLVRQLHAFRHRFMTLARRVPIEEQYVEAMAGHSPGRQNREYGDFPLEVLHREIERLDPVIVEGATRKTG